MVEKEEGGDGEEWGEKEKGGRRSRRLETSLGQPEALQAPGAAEGRAGLGARADSRVSEASAGSWGPSCREDMLHVMLDAGRGQLTTYPCPGTRGREHGPDSCRLALLQELW